jgi:hypothetical protein
LASLALGGGAAAVCWLVGLYWTGHPVLVEVAGAARRIRARLSRKA